MHVKFGNRWLPLRLVGSPPAFVGLGVPVKTHTPRSASDGRYLISPPRIYIFINAPRDSRWEGLQKTQAKTFANAYNPPSLRENSLSNKGLNWKERGSAFAFLKL